MKCYDRPVDRLGLKYCSVYCTHTSWEPLPFSTDAINWTIISLAQGSPRALLLHTLYEKVNLFWYTGENTIIPDMWVEEAKKLRLSSSFCGRKYINYPGKQSEVNESLFCGVMRYPVSVLYGTVTLAKWGTWACVLPHVELWGSIWSSQVSEPLFSKK